MVGWILGNFSTVNEVKAAFAKLNVSSVYRKELKLVPPLHHYVTDAEGNSIVLEFIDGKLKIWDNRVNGVMTNEPVGWHLENLRSLSDMRGFDVPIPELKDERWSLGAGLRGLPGDYTSASRFARISALKFFAETVKNGGSPAIDDTGRFRP
jgi:choloylglycine hydrolase